MLKLGTAYACRREGQGILAERSNTCWLTAACKKENSPLDTWWPTAHGAAWTNTEGLRLTYCLGDTGSTTAFL